LLLVLILTACADQTIMTSATLVAEPVQAELLVWGRGNAQDHMRANALLDAIRQEPELAGVSAQAEMFHIGAGSYASLWQSASDDGRPPDIVTLDTKDLLDWAANGRIIPLDDCLPQHNEFDDVRPELWTAVTWQNQRWGVPHELGLHLLYFNKTVLRQLGWSEADIRSLPQRIQNGTFSREEMTAVAKEAIRQGVVEPGFGFWPDLGKTGFLNSYAAAGGRFSDPEQLGQLILSRSALTAAYDDARRRLESGVSPDNAASAAWNQSFGRSVWQDAVTHGQVLFWSAPSWSWVRWAEYYVNDVGGDAYLTDEVGFAPQPGGVAGQPGFAWAEVRVYAISAGLDEAQQALACHALAAATTPAINLAHVSDNFYLPVLDGETAVSPVLAQMEPYTVVSLIPMPHEGYGRLLDILTGYLHQVETGELLPAEAAEAAIAEVETELTVSRVP